jgi:hypothetical protein
LEHNCYSGATSYQKNKCNNTANIPQFLITLHPLTFVTFVARPYTLLIRIKPI